jgi:hypothetical protein
MGSVWSESVKKKITWKMHQDGTAWWRAQDAVEDDRLEEAKVYLSKEEQDVIIAFGQCPQCGSDDILQGHFIRTWNDRSVPQQHCGCLPGWPRFGDKLLRWRDDPADPGEKIYE